MKTLGLLGGMSWESTQTYYQLLNRGVSQRLGGLHSASLILRSVNFAEVEALQHRGDWAELGNMMVDECTRLQAAGADGLIICTNTMHKLAPQVEQALQIPLLHIADATADALHQAGCDTVGLLGTAFTMEQEFYIQRLRDKGITVLIPDAEQRECVHRIIYQELCQGSIVQSSRDTYLRIVDALANRGAKGIVLGCTEIGLLLRPQDTSVPLYDTTQLHAAHAVNWALGQEA